MNKQKLHEMVKADADFYQAGQDRKKYVEKVRKSLDIKREKAWVKQQLCMLDVVCEDAALGGDYWAELVRVGTEDYVVSELNGTYISPRLQQLLDELTKRELEVDIIPGECTSVKTEHIIWVSFE